MTSSRYVYSLAHRLVHAVFFFSSRRRHTRCLSDWSSDVCSSDLFHYANGAWLKGTEIPPDRSSYGPGEQLTELTAERTAERSEERRVGKECRSRWSPYH